MPTSTESDLDSPPSLSAYNTTQQALARQLSSFFPERQDSRGPYTDSEINEISSLLGHLNQRWSQVPRTYVVLRTIDHLSLLDKLIEAGFSDYWFPVTQRTIPALMSPSAGALFLKTQFLILTESMHLEKGEKGQHCYYKQGESPPFSIMGVIGSGPFAQVDKVLSLISYKEYARKRVLRGSAFGLRSREHMMRFISELQILKRLKHRHIIELVGSYTDSKYMALIMSPVAEVDLDIYLTRATISNHDELRTFFGCLATALEYLHNNCVRHKDIKPRNILVRRGNVLFTDFGLSFDYSNAATGSTSFDIVDSIAPKYCSPEVALFEPRNTMSDIWSLGAVFMEMIVVLKGKTIRGMYEFFRDHGSQEPYIRSNRGAFLEFAAELERAGNLLDNKALVWTRQMLSTDRRLRPTASELVASILAPSQEGGSVNFCGICCSSEKALSDWVSSEDEFGAGQNISEDSHNTSIHLESHREEGQRLSPSYHPDTSLTAVPSNSVGNRAPELASNEQDEQTTTDSSYVSRSYGMSVQTKGSTGKDLEVITEDTEYTHEYSELIEPQPPTDKQNVQPLGLYTTETIYSESETSTLPPSQDKGYIVDLATELFNTVNSCKPNRETLERVSEILPGLLRAFALKIGYKANTPMQRDISYFIHKYRSSIQRSFEDLFPLPKIVPSDGVRPGEFAIGRYLEEQDSYTSSVDEIAPRVDSNESVSTEPSEESLGDPEPALGSGLYRNFIVKSPAYCWLIANVQRETALSRATPDVMEDIKDRILGVLPSTHKVSRRTPSMEYNATIDLDWDPLFFVKEQQYAEKPDEALKRAITLSGLNDDAQALTACEYLSQTWPATGEFVMELVADVVRDNTNYKATSQLPDGTKVTALIDGIKFRVIAVGTGDSLAEIVQQFAWLGAALRTSPPELANGIATCTPYVKDARLEGRTSLVQATALKGPVEIFCAIGFKIRGPVASTERPPGQCWHDMFRNPVMVNGYPILTKHESGLGLEMPLNMIAGLAGSDRAVEFNDNVFIKGFSTMLIATKLVGDLLIWHYFFKSRGERVSYLDYTPQGHRTNLLQLNTVRHVVGWSPGCQYFAGAKDAKYDIGGTGLPRPHPGAFLEKVTISGGKIITGGAIFAIGVNNIPPHLVRNGYIPKLMWMDTKYVVLWDESEKRGWLVNGTSALLHLVRASLKHYGASAFSSVLLFNPNKMNNTESCKPDSAVRVLIDPNNRELEIWPGKNEISKEEETKTKAGEIDTEESKSWKRKRGFTLFEDLVEQQYTILELIMEHHKHLAGQNGVNLKVRARKHLEGWDFKELATGYDPHPRVATLQAFGYGWVDFLRSIGAITLFGCGLGDIIRPSQFDGLCPQWTTLPKYKYHLAASMFDLNKIIETFGTKAAGPLEPVEGLLWHSPDRLFARCYCQKHNAGQKLTKIFRSHRDPVQVFYPKRSRLFLKTKSPDGLGNSGAIVFGHSVVWDYHWREGANKDANAEEEDLEEGPPPITVHELEAPNASPESRLEPAYLDADHSVTSRSTQWHQSKDGSMPHSLRSGYTSITTPIESAGSLPHKPTSEVQDYVDHDLWYMEQDRPTVVAPTRFNDRVRREVPEARIETECYVISDRNPPPSKLLTEPSQRNILVPRTTLGEKAPVGMHSGRALRREKRRI